MAKQEFESFTGKLDAPTEYESFDGTLDGETPKPSGALRDLGKSLKVGVQKLPGMVTGLADLPIALATGARPFTSAADAIGEATGFQPGKWADETQRSDNYKAGQANVNKAWAGVDAVQKDESASKLDYAKKLLADAPEIAGEYLKNPMYTANQVVESVPGMIAGGVASKVVRGLGALAGKGIGAEAAAAGAMGPVRQAVPGYVERAVGDKWVNPVVAGIGEGAVTAGSAMDQSTGEDQQKNALAALGAGAGTALIGVGAGRLANKLGLETSGTAMAKLGDGTLGNGLGATKRILGGAISEGAFQELPQSIQEAMWQNYADGKPIMQGVARQGIEGALSGVVMGAGANVFNSDKQATPPPEQPPAGPPADPLQIGNTPDPYISFPDGTVARRSEVEAYVNSLPADQQPAARAKMMGLEPQHGVPEPEKPAGPPAQLGYSPLAGTPTIHPDGTVTLNGEQEFQRRTQSQPAKPSEQMGLTPTDGPSLTNAAITAVDTGAHQAQIDQQELNDLVESERRNKQVMEAQISQERTKQQELDRIPAIANEQNVVQGAVDRAATLESPNALQQAMGKAQEKKKPIPVSEPTPVEPKIVQRTPDLSQPMPLELAQLQVEMDGGTVVRTRNQNGKFAYHVQPTSAKQANLDRIRKANNVSPTSPVQPIPATSGRQDGNQPTGSVGSGSADANGLGADAAGSQPGGVGRAGEQSGGVPTSPVAKGRPQPTTLGTQTSAKAGPGFSAKDVPSVKNPAPAASGTQAQATPDQAPQAVAGDAATAGKLPGAGSAQVESDGIKVPERTRYYVTKSPAYDGIEPLSVEDADFELEALENRARKGKLTPEVFAQSEIGTRIDAATIIGLQSSLKTDPVGTIQALRSHIANKSAPVSQSAQSAGTADEGAGASQPTQKARTTEQRKATLAYIRERMLARKNEQISQPQEQSNGTQAPETQPQQTQPEAGTPASIPEPAAVATGAGEAEGVKSKKPSLKQRMEDERKARADYFTPGNIVKSYGGHDEVISYTPPKEDGGGWSVKVHAIGYRDGKWVRIGKPQDTRTHSTHPDAQALKAGPIARLGYQPASEVVYSEPRADGQPFPNAVDRGTKPVVQAESAQSVKLETIAERLGFSVNKSTTGWHASGGMLSIPSEDADLSSAVSADHVFAHELGHGIMDKREVSLKGFPTSALKEKISNWPELVAASKEFRPGVHGHESVKARNHAMKPNEIAADAIASVLIGNKPLSLLQPFMDYLGINKVDLGLQTVDEANAESRAAKVSETKPTSALAEPAPVAIENVASEPSLPDNWRSGTNQATNRPTLSYNPQSGAHWATVHNVIGNAYEIEYRKGQSVVESVEVTGSRNDVIRQVQERVAELSGTPIHQDPGKAPEAATAPVIAQSLAKAARKEDHTQKEMRLWLVGEIDKAVKLTEDYADYQESIKKNGQDIADSIFFGKRGSSVGLTTPQGNGTITFDVPGDGKFKIRNSLRGLMEFRAKVEAKSGTGFTDKPTKAKGLPASTGVAKGSSSQIEALSNMLEELDFEAAVDYARETGTSLNDAKISPEVRKQFETYLKDGTEPQQFSPSRYWEYPGIDGADKDGNPIRRATLTKQIGTDEYQANVTGTNATGFKYNITKSGKSVHAMLTSNSFANALKLAEDAINAIQPEVVKPKDTGWNMAGVGFAGKRYRGRNITLDDGREVVARIYENAGQYEDAEVKVDGVSKFRKTDRYKAEKLADDFIRTLTAKDPAKAPIKVTPQVAGNTGMSSNADPNAITQNNEDANYIPKGWKKDGAYYEFRSASGSKFTPTQIAEVVGGTVTKQGMHSIIGVPVHGWETAKRRLKDAGMWIERSEVAQKEDSKNGETIPAVSEAQARKQFEWRNMGQKGGTKSHLLFFFESEKDKGTGAAMNRGEVSLYPGASGWKVEDGDGTSYKSLADAKKAAIDLAIPKLQDQGYILKPAQAATAILDAANVTGKERIDALKDVKKGDITPEELQAAYPAIEGVERAEPWKMTRAEAAESFPGDEYDKMLNRSAVLGDITYEEAGKRSRINVTGNKEFWAKTRKDLLQDKKDAVKFARGDRAEVNKLKPTEGFAAWRIKSMSATGKSSIEAAGKYHDELLAVHKERVQEALDEGKDVPPEVLADYPDLAKSSSAQPAAKSAIGDFGQKIGGAKKDTWTGFKDDLNSVKDDDIASRKLSEIWPAPDYQKMIDDGMDAKSVALIRSIRDEVPSKPRSDYKLRRWAEQVKEGRALALSILNEKNKGDTLYNELTRIGGKLSSIAGRADLYMAVGHEKSLEGIRLAHHHYSLYKGRENVSMWVAERDSAATAFSNFPQELATGDTKEQAIAAFKAKYDTLDATAAVKKAAFVIFTKGGGDKGFYIGKKIGRNIADMAGPFAALKEARAYRESNLAELEAKLEKYKEIPKERRDTNEPRVGEDMRNGRDVTPEMFSEAFGFKGVEFGNWVEQKRRQKDLNDAFDALMDMAAIMGVPAKAISLNGELGLAFGARGSGGVNPAAAHYESDKIVINLTKREGAGSLGHEWWHALDNYFSRQRGGRTSPYMTTTTDVGLSSRGSNYVAYDGVRKEMIDAFGEVVKSIRLTAMKARSSKMDAKRTKEYWTTGEEMAARAFESYLISKLHDQNASNDYLANVVDQKTWDAMAALGMENEDSYPYPTAGEMPLIRTGFDKFFQTLETKETESGNVAMYSQSATTESTARTTYDTPSTVQEVQKAIRQLIGITGRNKLGGTVATTAAEIKSTWEPLTGQNVNIESEGDAGRAQAYFDPKTNTVFLIADHIRAGTEMAVAAHELMHKHGQSVLGKDGWDKLHSVISTWANADPESDERLIYNYAASKVRAVGESLSSQELFPYAVEGALKAGYKPNAMARQGSVQKWLAGVIQSMREVWGKITGKPDSFKVQDLVDLAFGIAQMENPDLQAVGDFRDTNEAVTKSNDVVGNQSGRSADDTTPGVLFTDENDNAIVYEREGFRISVNRPGAASYVVLWAKQEVNGKTYWRKAGTLDTNQKTKKVGGVVGEYLGVSSIEIEKAYRAQGLGLEMYRALMANAAPNIAGVISHTPNRVNKQQVPSIYRKLGAFTDGDNQIIPIGRNEPTAPDSGGEPIAQTDTPAFRKWFGDSKVVDADGNPLVVYHGTPDASFTEFKEGSHFTADPDYAAVYTNTSASSINAQAKRADAPATMPVYLSIQKPFDTRIPSVRRVFEKEFFGKWGNGTPLSDRGLPDWTDARDILEWIDETDQPFDGILVDEGGTPDGGHRGLAWAPVKNTQIKSATGNSGQFDGENPDIRFSRSLGDTLTNASNSARDVNLPAGYKVGDLFNSVPGKLNWWHKTVGTQYNLAQRSKPFKRVYDAVQTFINDVSYFATEAADLAPNILPKLESWKDIAKSPLSAEDTKALSTPVFEGTLTWSRDESGKPVKMAVLEDAAKKLTPEQKAQRLLRGDHLSQNVLKMWQGLPIDQYESLIEGKYESDMLKAGIVFTPAELKSLFSLNDKQVSLYQEFRKSVDKSLTNLAVADMIRFGGKDVDPIREQVLESKTVGEAAEMLRDYLLSVAGDSDVLVDTANKMIDKGDKAQDLMDRGYAPLSRFGTYTLDVVDAEGERAYFGMFESAAEASKMRRKMEGLYPGAAITQGTVSEQAYKMFAGVSPETLELFGDMLGLESQGDSAASQAFQEYLKLAKSSRSAMKRLIQRKGIAGFSEDAGRVLAGFVYSNARQTASSLHMGEMTNAANDIDKTQGELKDAAVKLVDYIKNPQEEAQKLRGLLFAQYIGGSVASAMVNMTQPITMTFPWLSQYGGVSSAAKQMTAAMKDSGKKSTGDTKLDAALHRAEEDGTVSPQEVHQLMAQSQGRGALQSGDGTRTGDALAKANNALSKVSLAWGKLFGVAEQFNRRVTFIAAYRTAVAQGIANPDAFARKAIAETQGVYNKGNAPAWSRGAVGKTIFVFKQYSIAYVEMISRMAKNGEPGSKERAQGQKAALLALAVLFLLSGAGGMPGADDLDDVISGAMQSMGYNFDSKMKRKEFFVSILGEGGAQFMERGVSGLPGVPIDVSGRMGLGNLIPGTGLFTKKADHTRDVAELAGPAGDFVKRGFDAAGKLITGDVGGAVDSVSPKAIQNLTQAYDMANRGMYRDAKGMKVLDTDGYDALVKSIGFQPNDVKRAQDANFEVTRMIGLNKLNETDIANRWAMGVFEKDASKIQDARDDLAEWNRANPESPIRIDFKQIRSRVQKMNETKAQRIAKTAPREIRAAVRQELVNAQ